MKTYSLHISKLKNLIVDSSKSKPFPMFSHYQKLKEKAIRQTESEPGRYTKTNRRSGIPESEDQSHRVKDDRRTFRGGSKEGG